MALLEQPIIRCYQEGVSLQAPLHLGKPEIATQVKKVWSPVLTRPEVHPAHILTANKDTRMSKTPGTLSLVAAGLPASANPNKGSLPIYLQGLWLALASFVPAFVAGLASADALIQYGGCSVDISMECRFLGVGFALWSLFLIRHLTRTASLPRLLAWAAAVSFTMGMLFIAAQGC